MYYLFKQKKQRPGSAAYKEKPKNSRLVLGIISSTLLRMQKRRLQRMIFYKKNLRVVNRQYFQNNPGEDFSGYGSNVVKTSIVHRQSRPHTSTATTRQQQSTKVCSLNKVLKELWPIRALLSQIIKYLEQFQDFKLNLEEFPQKWGLSTAPSVNKLLLIIKQKNCFKRKLSYVVCIK